MISFEALQSKQEKVCVVGLGYVGLPLAVLLSKHFAVIGFDINEKRIEALAAGIDHTAEVSAEALAAAEISYTTNPDAIAEAGFIIIAVPTPIDKNNTPDLTLLKKATEVVGGKLKKDAVVVYESTVYPGVTEEICMPLLEQASGLGAGVDFFVGYSPERVNPGDKEHTIDKVVKVVSGMDDATSELISRVYGSFTNTFKAASIRVAEAAKAIENTQRDLNIALMNELAVLFNKLGISTYDVLEAAGTKWNFLPFTPGLVGGHCIGVDPYYLTYKAKEVGHTPEVILAGRGINDSMHTFIAHRIIKEMIRMGKNLHQATIVIFGITFKENISDIRNSKVAALYRELKDFGLNPIIHDPLADPDEVKREYDIVLTPKEDLPKADTLVVAVAHDAFKDLSAADLRSRMNHENLLLIDIKHLYNKNELEAVGVNYWTL
jgi:UDP-N-acetyl-D-galactosamine dehydrogenase